MKAKILLVAAVMFLGLAASAYAQATYTVSSTPVTTVTKTGMTERTGDITFTPVQPPVPAALGTIQVSYGGVSITNAGAAIVDPTTRLPIAGGPAVASIDYLHGVVVINVPLNFNGAFTLTGVRVQISGTPLTKLDAQISAVNNFIVAGQTTPTVITAVGDGIVLGTNTAGQVNLISGAVIKSPELIVTEGYLNSFGVARNGLAVNPNDQTNGVVIRFTLSQLPPKGYTITFPGTVTAVLSTTAGTTAHTLTSGVFRTVTVSESTDGTTTTNGVTASGAPVVITSTSGAAGLKFYYELSSDSDSTKLESLDLQPTFTYDTVAGGLPVPSATITWTATLYPVGIGLASGGTLPTNQPVPRYAALELGPATLLGAPTGLNKTTILIPYAARVTGTNWDTGIAIANTTADPGTKLAVAGAVPQTGGLHFYFYNAGSKTAAPSSFTYDTGANSPGSGLDANGQLAPGSTYSVNLSELIKAANSGNDLGFSGYIFVITDFGLGHAQYLLTDYSTVANGGQGMIIAIDRTSPEALNH